MSYCTITHTDSTHILCRSILFCVDFPWRKRWYKQLNDLSLVCKDSCLFFALPRNCLNSFDCRLRVIVTFSGIPSYPESAIAFFPGGSIWYSAVLSSTLSSFLPPRNMVPSCIFPHGSGPRIQTIYKKKKRGEFVQEVVSIEKCRQNYISYVPLGVAEHTQIHISVHCCGS